MTEFNCAGAVAASNIFHLFCDKINHSSQWLGHYIYNGITKYIVTSSYRTLGACIVILTIKPIIMIHSTHVVWSRENDVGYLSSQKMLRMGNAYENWTNIHNCQIKNLGLVYCLYTFVIFFCVPDRLVSVIMISWFITTFLKVQELEPTLAIFIFYRTIKKF